MVNENSLFNTTVQYDLQRGQCQFYDKNLHALGFCDCASWANCKEREKKPTRCNNQMFIINFCLNMFRASSCPSSGEQRPCATACGVQMGIIMPIFWRTKTMCYCMWCADGHDDARNTRQKLIINIWLLHLVGFFSLFTKTFMFVYKLLALSISTRITFNKKRQAQEYNKCEYLQN